MLPEDFLEVGTESPILILTDGSHDNEDAPVVNHGLQDIRFQIQIVNEF